MNINESTQPNPSTSVTGDFFSSSCCCVHIYILFKLTIERISSQMVLVEIFCESFPFGNGLFDARFSKVISWFKLNTRNRIEYNFGTSFSLCIVVVLIIVENKIIYVHFHRDDDVDTALTQRIIESVATP